MGGKIHCPKGKAFTYSGYVCTMDDKYKERLAELKKRLGNLAFKAPEISKFYHCSRAYELMQRLERTCLKGACTHFQMANNRILKADLYA
jgi:hypothetical protein